MRKLSNNELASLLGLLRANSLKYNEVKKKDLWQMLRLLITNPSLGLYNDGDEDSYKDELRRIIKIYFNPDTLDNNAAIMAIGGKLNFDTILVLYQFLHYHIIALSDAKYLISTRPGEFEKLSEELGLMSKKVQKDEIEDLKKVKMSISADLLLDMSMYVTDMALSAEDLLNVADNKTTDK